MVAPSAEQGIHHCLPQTFILKLLFVYFVISQYTNILVYLIFFLLQVKTPKKIKEPELAFKLPHNNEASSIMFGGASKVW